MSLLDDIKKKPSLIMYADTLLTSDPERMEQAVQ